MERIFGARRMADVSLPYRILWYGYGREDDTWEPTTHLPTYVVKKFHRRTVLPYF
jgi:Chromo (CHRromatin Organisation MOdifier) domain